MSKEKQLPSLAIGEYELKYPIIGGGMSIKTGGSKVAAAVAECGGGGTLGGVGLGYIPRDRREAGYRILKAERLALQQELRVTRNLCPDGIIGANILMAARYHKEMIQAAIEAEAGINYLTLGAGFNPEVPEWTKEHPEVALLLMASSDKAAMTMAAGWREHGRLPDAIIMEEPATAGGHLGASWKMVYKDMYKLDRTIPALIESLQQKGWNIPVIAAGGIWDRKDIDHYLSLGAKGVQMASRFVCTPECAAAAEFKQMYLKARKEDAILIASPVGYPGRALRNPFTEKYEQGEIHDQCDINCLTKCECRESKGERGFCIIKRLNLAFEGNVDNGLVFCGSNAWRSKEQGIVPVSKIFKDLTD